MCQGVAVSRRLVIVEGSEQKKKGGRNADSLHTARSASARGYVTM